MELSLNTFIYSKSITGALQRMTISVLGATIKYTKSVLGGGRVRDILTHILKHLNHNIRVK